MDPRVQNNTTLIAMIVISVVCMAVSVDAAYENISYVLNGSGVESTDGTFEHFESSSQPSIIGKSTDGSFKNYSGFLRPRQQMPDVVFNQAECTEDETIALQWTTQSGSFVDPNALEYDVLYYDADSFTDASADDWQLLKTVSGFETTDDSTWSTPVRFYRVAVKDRWKKTRIKREASPEIFCAVDHTLDPGVNWVGLAGIPETDTPAGVFGRDLPSGATPLTATRISWHEKGPGAMYERVIWLEAGATPHWKEGNTIVDDSVVVPTRDSCVMRLPGESSVTKRIVTKLPVVASETNIVGNGASNFVCYNLPESAHPNDMNLLESGFHGGIFPSHADMIMKYNSASQGILSSDIIFYNTQNSRWEFAVNRQPVPSSYSYDPGDAIMIKTGIGTSDWVWTNKLSYTPPTKYMTP